MLQIQPSYKNGDDYIAFAKANNLTFEALEPSFFIDNADMDRWYDTCGLISSVHGAFIDVNPASSDPLFRELSVKRCNQSCEMAVRYGAKNVVFHSSCFPFLRGAYLDNRVKICAEFYPELAEKYNLNIFIENSPDTDPVPIKSLMDAVKGTNVFTCLDIGHSFYSRENLKIWIDELYPNIRYIHLSDNLGLYDDHLELGKGVIDWTEAGELLKGVIDENTPITLEVGGIENVKNSIAYLKNKSLFGM